MTAPETSEGWLNDLGTHFSCPDVGMEGSVKTLVSLSFPRRRGH